MYLITRGSISYFGHKSIKDKKFEAIVAKKQPAKLAYKKELTILCVVVRVTHNEQVIEDAKKMGQDELWHFSIEAEPYHGNYEFVSEENEKVFWENIYSLMLEGDSLVDHKVSNKVKKAVLNQSGFGQPFIVCSSTPSNLWLS